MKLKFIAFVNTDDEVYITKQGEVFFLFGSDFTLVAH